jgi:hypothetical protein
MILILGCGGGGGQGQVDRVITEQSATAKPDGSISLATDSAKVTAVPGSFTPGTEVHLRVVDPAQGFTNREVEKASNRFDIDTPEASATPVSVEFPAPPGDEPMVVATFDGAEWQPLDFQKGNGKITVELTEDSALQRPNWKGRSPGFGWSILAGSCRSGMGMIIGPPKLEWLAGDKTGPGENSAIILHGIFSNAGKFKEYANHIQSRYHYKNVYGISYYWPNGIKKNAEDIASLLSSMHLPNKSIVLHGHSLGGLVIRYMLEVVQFSQPFREAFFLHTPNEGSKWANAQLVLRGLNALYINNPMTLLTGCLLSTTDQVAFDLMPGSPILQTLKNNPPAHRGEVAYRVAGYLGDEVVPLSSQLAQNTNLSERTAGFVETASQDFEYTFEVGHSYLTANPDGREFVTNHFSEVFPPSDPSPKLSISSPSQSYDTSTQAYWDWAFSIQNDRSHPVSIKDVQLTVFDKNGAHMGTQWFKENNVGIFPFTYVPMNASLAGTSKRDFGIRLECGPDYPGRLDMATTVVLAHVTDPTTQTEHTLTLRLLFTRNGIPPLTAQTRSRETTIRANLLSTPR